MVGINSKLHQESGRHPIDANTDFEAAFPDVDREEQRDTCILEAPGTAGHEDFMCSCSPSTSFCEVVDGVKQWTVCCVEGGAVQGDLIDPAIFPLLQAGVRATNDAAPDKHHSDFMDDAVHGADVVKDGKPCFDVVDTFVAADTAAKKWGGRNSPRLRSSSRRASPPKSAACRTRSSPSSKWPTGLP